MRNKYGARRVVTAEGDRFDSQKEYARWGELQLLERAGRISELSRQDRYPFDINGIRVGVYVCDFTYVMDGNIIVEDVKSPSTAKIAVYRMKKKLMRAIYGIDIAEV